MVLMVYYIFEKKGYPAAIVLDLIVYKLGFSIAHTVCAESAEVSKFEYACEHVFPASNKVRSHHQIRLSIVQTQLHGLNSICLSSGLQL